MALQILEVAGVVKQKRHHLNFPVDNHSRICEDVRVQYGNDQFHKDNANNFQDSSSTGSGHVEHLPPRAVV